LCDVRMLIITCRARAALHGLKLELEAFPMQTGT